MRNAMGRFILLWASESGQAVGHLMLSVSATALILAIAYYGGSYWGEDLQKFIAPAFDWQ